MVLKKNKKGMFFTLITIALLSLILVSITIFPIAKDRAAVNKRINTMNNFVFSLEEDLPRKLYISGFRIIFLYEKRMLETGQYISDVNSSFNEAFFNGTIEGTISSDELNLIQGVTFEEIKNDLNQKASKVNLIVNLSNPNIVISQESPWNIKIILTLNLFIKDRGGLASWNKTSTIESYIPVENFEDPVYLINTNGQISHKINKTIYKTFATGANVSNLTNHLNNFNYIGNSDAPSFLNRLEGNLTADSNGIESLVNIQELTSNGISIEDKVIVDHIYFSTSNPTKRSISGMPSWFKLDDSHLDIYNVSGLVI